MDSGGRSGWAILRLHSAIGGLANPYLAAYGVVKGDAMIAKVTSNRQIALRGHDMAVSNLATEMSLNAERSHVPRVRRHYTWCQCGGR